MRATIITDASFCPKTKAAGWAAWITANPPNGKVVRLQRSGPFNDDPDSPVHAEVRAAMNGLWLAYTFGARDLLLQSDCTAVGSMLRRGTYDYPSIASEKWPEARVRFRHVKGHTQDPAARSWVNRWCDREARKHMKQLRGERGWLNVSAQKS